MLIQDLPAQSARDERALMHTKAVSYFPSAKGVVDMKRWEKAVWIMILMLTLAYIVTVKVC